MIGSAVVLVVILLTMLEREVMAPLHHVTGMLEETEPSSRVGRADEVSQIQTSVARLVERERRVEEIAAARDRRLAAQEGLAQVGELAAEMAHEFKRPMASIRTAVDVLQQEYVLEEGGRKMLAGLNSQLERLGDTMQDLFSLARPVVLETESVSLPDTLDDTLVELAGYPGMERVELGREYEEAPPVRGDRRRLEQAFLNVMVNAVEAMPRGGRLDVTIRPAGDDGVEVAFQDTGSGMTREDMERAFRPFHSTKPVGTGLGLPLVARIVAAHRGRIDVESAPGEGTTFRIVLPLEPELRLEEPAWRESESSSWTTMRSSGT